MADEDLYKAPTSDVTTEYDGGFDETHPLSPKGRIGRIRYLGHAMLAALAFMVAIMIVGAMSGLLSDQPSEAMGAIGAVLFIGLYIAFFVVTFILMIRRLHDINRRGWYSALMIIPIVNIILGFILLLVPGTAGANDYGPPPKPSGGGAAVVIALFFILFIGGILAAVAIPAYQDYVKAAEAAQTQQ